MLIALVILLYVPACVGPAQTHLDVRQPLTTPLPQKVTYAFASNPEDNPDLVADFDKTIRIAISNRIHGRQVDDLDLSDILISHGFSDRPTTVAVVDRSSPKRKRLFQCAGRLVRFSINIIDRESGRSIYSASAEQKLCKVNAQVVAPQLIARVLPDGAWPTQSKLIRGK